MTWKGIKCELPGCINKWKIPVTKKKCFKNETTLKKHLKKTKFQFKKLSFYKGNKFSLYEDMYLNYKGTFKFCVNTKATT